MEHLHNRNDENHHVDKPFDKNEATNRHHGQSKTVLSTPVHRFQPPLKCHRLRLFIRKIEIFVHTHQHRKLTLRIVSIESPRGRPNVNFHC